MRKQQLRLILFSTLLSLNCLTTLVQAQQETTTVGGYGELHYNDLRGGGANVDFHRFVIYIEHSYNDWVVFKSETEIEHTKLEDSGSSGGELAIEQAYLDLQFSKWVGMRAGILLPPIGIINEIHEPPTFHGVERPNFDRNLIPTTWRESGIGIYGNLWEGMKYKLYLMAGLDASGFSGASGIRGGRQEAAESSTKNPSVTGKIEYVPLAGLKMGGSFWVGNSISETDTTGSGKITLVSMDIQYNVGAFQLRTVATMIQIGDTDKINAKYNASVGSHLNGFYMEGAYNLMPLFFQRTEQEIFTFARLEKYNTQVKMATGYSADKANDRTEWTFGFTYRPAPKVALKLDYQIFVNANRKETKRQLNAGMGYMF